MKELIELIKTGSEFLTKRVVEYAKLHNYTKYTATLEENWQASIDGLSKTLLDALEEHGAIPELNVDEDYSSDKIGFFGVKEAQLHRSRGVTLTMFLGLMKDYRQSYMDLIRGASLDNETEFKYLVFVCKFFDRVEMAFCTEWTGYTKEVLIKELQDTNRVITNEKSKYLTIFESIPSPVIILDSNSIIDNMNKAAMDFLQEIGQEGISVNRKNKSLTELIPWISDESRAFIKAFIEGGDMEATIEKDLELPGIEPRHLVVRFQRMLDYSDKFKGMVIIFTDFTDKKQIENRLRFISYHDELTGLYNRAYFQEEMSRLDSGRYDPAAIIVCDVDGLKMVNDTLGHQAGDRLIVITAAILMQSVRENDVVARVGGDEFAIALPSVSTDGLEGICERITTAVAKHNQENPLRPISFSLGAAWGNTLNGSIDEIYRNADNEMYRNKEAARGEYKLLFDSRYAEYGDKLFGQ